MSGRAAGTRARGGNLSCRGDSCWSRHQAWLRWVVAFLSTGQQYLTSSPAARRRETRGTQGHGSRNRSGRPQWGVARISGSTGAHKVQLPRCRWPSPSQFWRTLRGTGRARDDSGSPRLPYGALENMLNSSQHPVAPARSPPDGPDPRCQCRQACNPPCHGPWRWETCSDGPPDRLFRPLGSMPLLQRCNNHARWRPGEGPDLGIRGVI